MNTNEFHELLNVFTQCAVKFARQYVLETLPDEILYYVELNCSADANCDAKFRTYPEDEKKVYKYVNAEQVAQILVRENRIPVWIDISVMRVRKGKTIVELLCAGRYTDDKEELYYKSRGQGPFGIKSPILPIDFAESKEKFYLNERYTLKFKLTIFFRRRKSEITSWIDKLRRG